ncbi:MOT1 [Candida theae]|uniref:TATA-binding protein-associated factor mot1 n=1 Tax=Candida theae TaxID=1198502 RepID=A0AAD5FYN6_9ASCO|nr:MOT1 [Candida theae]KAI5958274.1 MOT1 [Candida theae]
MSRLDRLVVLLETGSTSFIRNTAADQLSDLAKAHPEDILNLLARVYPFLKSPKWETRIAAARAFGGIVNNAPVWDPNSQQQIKEEVDAEDLVKREVEDSLPYESKDFIKQEAHEEVKIKIEQDLELNKLDDSISNLLSFSNFDLNELIKSGTTLLASKSDNTLNNSEEVDEDDRTLIGRIKRHRASTLPKPENTPESESEGVESAMQSKIKTESDPLIKQELESGDKTSCGLSSPNPSRPPLDPATKPVSSARLKAMQKRRAKFNAKSGATNKMNSIDFSQSSISRQMVESGDTMDIDFESNANTTQPQFDVTSQQGGEKLVVEAKIEEISPLLSLHNKVAGLIWLFQGVYELLLADLFDDKWEIRHGAALGLRELIRKHGKGAGRIMNKTKEENDHNNASTLEDLAVRLCILFVLDRFGDYVSDTVVAPVRESCAQTLAALLIHLDDSTVIKTFDCLYTMTLQEGIPPPKCWEAKHGGMLGVRYLVSVRTDVLLGKPEMFDQVLNLVLHGLQESDDDVQSVAALTLTPIASEVVSTRKTVIQSLLAVIWDCLVNLRDDLSASIGSVMDLLAKLCSHKEVIDIIQLDAAKDDSYSFKHLAPRLYPFLRHSITNVRKAALRTILEFLSITEDNITPTWIDAKTLRLVFQNLLVEQNPDVLQLSITVYNKLLEEVDKYSMDLKSLFVSQASDLLTLTMTPIGIARTNYQMDTALIMRPSGQMVGSLDNDESRHGKKRSRLQSQNQGAIHEASAIPIEDLKINIDAPMYKGDVMLVGFEKMIATRCAGASAIGKTLALIKDQSILGQTLQLLASYLNSPYGTSRLLSAFVVEEFATAVRQQDRNPEDYASAIFAETLSKMLQDTSALSNMRELIPSLKAVRTSCLQLFDSFVSTARLSPSKIPQIPILVQGEADAGPNAFTLESAEKITGEIFEKLKKSLSSSHRLAANQVLEDAKHRVTLAIDDCRSLIGSKTTAILASYAGATLALSGIPKKLNPIIKSLMESIKLEDSLVLQKKSVSSVANLIRQLNDTGKKSVADKIIKNLCAFLCVDTAEVPEFRHNVGFKTNILSLRKEEGAVDHADAAAHERAVHEARIKRRGALLSLEEIILMYKENLFVKVPKLKELMVAPLKELATTSSDEIVKDELKGQGIIDALGILKALLPKIDKSLHLEITDHLDLLLPGLKSEYSVFRYSTAKCFATICSVAPTKAFTFLVNSILPMLKNAGSVIERQGAIETIYHISAVMGASILPYVMFLIVPVLGRMSDSDHDVRVLATTTFASIIKLVPLEAGIPDPEDMPQELLEGRERERDFISQMMDPTKIKPFDLPVSIKATLRKYQQEGVNWLAFLNKYHLHGILCDDMGLGKTLQTICIISSDHHIRAEKYVETGAVEYRRLPSLVVCPPSLTGHWEQEINQYAPFMKVLVYAGNPSIRTPLRNQLPHVDVVVTSYDVSRNDVEFLSSIDYNYCVLDEGHIIKNANSKLSKSVKRIKAEHRLILSGTPIQNNVLELWSLFDFLMPGFLGTEKVFHEKFAKPIAASRNSKTSSKEQEAGALALESLHKQVLPFMLRRLKEDVLSDLPPKIIQDYYCELSDLQKKLYKDFAKNEKDSIKNDVSSSEKEGKTHVFQALQYMRKLCNHPALVVSPNHPKHIEVEQFLMARKSQLRDIEHSPKLQSLRTLLLECGIGIQDSDYGKSRYKKTNDALMPLEGVISEHRALIFCQLKDMLDIVENDLLKKYLPSVSYMRLDGSTDPRNRQAIVRKFNDDPSIDVLLLTTKVGGLGLNLTGADTVIFVEHDWNPMNDLQAMDRAHRLGQKKVVNVYRLITKDTLEEKIMGLQKFKMNIASTIVNQQNAGLQSMDTNQLLDLFDVEDGGAKIEEGGDNVDENGANGNGGGSNLNNGGNNVTEELTGGLTGKAAGAVGELAELWDEQQYEDEYNLDNFIKTLK